MTCKRCGTTITEQTYSIYWKRCVPCFNRLPIQRLKKFCDYAVPFLVGLLFLPVYLTFYILRRLWRLISPVPFKRSEILRLMTPHFGCDGAIEYADGLRNGFQEGSLQRRSSRIQLPKSKNIDEAAHIFSIGREDGYALRRHPNNLKHILERRCKDPLRNKLRKRVTSKRNKRLSGISLIANRSPLRTQHKMELLHKRGAV